MSTAALALDVNQSAPVTATASNAPTNQGFDWALSCGGGNCGTITAHTASGASATFTAPAVALSIAVTITAKLTGLTNSGTTSAAVSAPPTVAKYDADKHTISIYTENDSKKNVMSYSRPEADHLIIEGPFREDMIFVKLKKIDHTKFNLLNTGFHWVNDQI